MRATLHTPAHDRPWTWAQKAVFLGACAVAAWIIMAGGVVGALEIGRLIGGGA